MPFTYTGTSTAAALTVGVLNDAITFAAQQTLGVDTRVDQTLGFAANAPTIGTTPNLDNVAVPTPPSINFSPEQALSLYDSTRLQITQQLSDGFTNYLTTYFPLGTELTDAIAWVKRALTTGGSGVNTTVEAQLWDRDRSRILSDAQRVEDETAATWAARRYPTPPGALTYQVLQVRRDAQKAIAESSRGQAIKVFDTEVENARLAIDKAIDLRKAAISTALDYIKALALGPQLGATLASTLIDAEAKVATVFTEFYRAQVAAAEIPLRIGTTNAELLQRTNEANQKSQVDTLRLRVDATMAAAQALSVQAAAVLNGFHAAVGVQGSESL